MSRHFNRISRRTFIGQYSNETKRFTFFIGNIFTCRRLRIVDDRDRIRENLRSMFNDIRQIEQRHFILVLVLMELTVTLTPRQMTRMDRIDYERHHLEFALRMVNTQNNSFNCLNQLVVFLPDFFVSCKPHRPNLTSLDAITFD